MTASNQPFLTTQKNDYKWPYSVSLVAKPSQPPIKTKSKNFYVAKLTAPYCHCDYHLYEPQMNRYKKLEEKQRILYQELEEANSQMAQLAGEILEQPCDTYEIKMKGLVDNYQKVMSAVDSPGDVNIENKTQALRDGYRDPTRFRYSTFVKTPIDVCPSLNYEKTPKSIDEWFIIKTGRGEYQDTVNNTGISILKNSQQYAEPLPSSRRRYGDLCL